MKALMITLCCLGLASIACAESARMPVNNKAVEVLPERAARICANLIAIATQYGAMPTDMTHQAWLKASTNDNRRFFALLDELAETTDGKHAEQLGQIDDAGVELALVSMARGMATEPKRYAELTEYYRMPQRPENGPSPAVLRPPALNHKHLTPDYLHAWHALVLAPPTEETAHFYNAKRGAPIDAVSKIGNPASIPVLTLAFAATCSSDHVDSSTLDRQLDLLLALNSYHTVDSLNAVFQCLEFKRESGQDMTAKLSGRDLGEWVLHMLTYSSEPQGHSDWADVLETYDAGNLRLEYRQIIQRARSKTEADRSKQHPE